MKCGAVYVPLDPSYPSERLKRMLEGLDVRIGLGTAGLPICNDRVNWLDASVADELSSTPGQPRQVDAEDPAYVMFTSGSTGRPKGIEVPHRAIVRLVFGQDFARMGPGETWLHMAPTSFDASTLEIWAALLHGGRCVILEKEVPTPSLLHEVIRQENVTSAWITSSLFNMIVDEAPACLSGLAQILIGGEALSSPHVRRALDHLPGVRLVNGYGPTENTTFTCCHTIRREDAEPGRTIPIGRPIANTTVHVFDIDGRPAPVGFPGELVAGGDGIALGYVGQPEQTKKGFLSDQFSGARLYRTGDRVRWRPDGLLEFLGRFDNQVKIRGHRVEPDEVAACLAEHDSVRQAVVTSQITAAGATQLVAYVVPKSKDYSSLELRELLIRQATGRLPAYMVPTTFLFLQELPLTLNGKLDLAALENAKRASKPARKDAPLSSTGTRILAIMRDVLHYENLGPDDDFFEMGGDSLLTLTLTFRLESDFGRDVKTHLIEGKCTARRLAAILESPSNLSAAYPAGVAEIRAGTTGTPLFFLPGMDSTALQFRTLAAKLHTGRPALAIELHNLEVGPAVLESIEETAEAIIGRMREVQPAGPYAIIGYSFGGNLAVEVARQLTANDQGVELVTILDAYAPGSLRNPSGLSKLATHLRIIARQNLRESYGYVSYRIQRRLFRRSSNTDPVPQLPESRTERRLAEVTKHCLRAFHSHSPKAFTGQIVLLSATDRGDWTELADPDGAHGWRSICTDGVHVIPVACRHLDLLKEPYVTDLAGHINNLLSAIDRVDFRHISESPRSSPASRARLLST
jgi:amino acid adenylation domain-containing protein